MISNYLENNLTQGQKDFINFYSDDTQDMLRQLDLSVITADYGISLPYIAETNPKLVKDFTYLMYKLNLGTVDSRRDYARFEFNMTVLDPKEVQDYRIHSKLDKFLMREDLREYSDTLVKRPNGLQNDGCPRPGMAISAKRKFQIDTKMLRKYLRPIKQNMIKSIKKGIENGNISEKFFADKASFRIITDYCLSNYMDPTAVYNSEANYQDQRGRAVKKILKRIGNYIANKDFRAMLVAPAKPLYFNDTQALDSIFLFIAELNGHKCIGQMESDKIAKGKECYDNKELPRLNLKDDHGRKELHELIWLERIYNKLDKFYKAQSSRFCTVDHIMWDIPIEIDHSMSMAQIMGALTNDIRILESTNMIEGPIQDPWFIEGVQRKVAKAVYTPKLYGSYQSAKALVRAKKETATNEELRVLKQVEKEGRFSVMLQLRDLFITNANIDTPIVDINTGVSQLKIYVSKFKSAGTKTIVTEAYNGKTFKYSFNKKKISIPDYKAMKTFWHTCGIHHLDSDLMDHNLYTNNHLWALDIHDAIICLPMDANTFREGACKRLEYYRDNRHTIIQNYRKSIGAVTTKADIAYMNLLKSIKDAGNIRFHRGCMA